MRRVSRLSPASSPGLLGILVESAAVIGSLSCGSSCTGCASGAHYEFVCTGFIAPLEPFDGTVIPSAPSLPPSEEPARPKPMTARYG